MASAAPRREYISLEERDQLELEYRIKYEWFDGEVFAMAGASFAHNRITASVLGQFYRQLSGQPCESLGSDQRVSVTNHRASVYPDIVVACPPHEWDQAQHDSLLNPRVIIEVLSPSTERHDRNDKFAMYRSIASLKHYILIASTHKSLEHFERDGERWIYNVARGDDDCIVLSDLSCQLCVRETYERLDLPSVTLVPQRNDDGEN